MNSDKWNEKEKNENSYQELKCRLFKIPVYMVPINDSRMMEKIYM